MLVLVKIFLMISGLFERHCMVGVARYLRPTHRRARNQDISQRIP